MPRFTNGHIDINMYKYKYKYVCIYDTKIILLSTFLSFCVDLNYFCTWKESTKIKIVSEWMNEWMNEPLIILKFHKIFGILEN